MSEEQQPSKQHLLSGRRVRALALSVVLAVGCGWIMKKGGLPMLPPAGAFTHLNELDMAGFVFGMTFNMVTRFWRCHFLIAPIAKVPLRRIMTINAIGMAFITFLPLRIGEFARPAMLRKRGHLSAWAVTGTVGAERILDGVVFSAMLLIGLVVAHPQDPLPDHIGALAVHVSFVPTAGRIASIFFGVSFVIMMAFYAYRAPARAITERAIGTLSPKLGKRIADIVERLSDGLGFLVNFRYTAPYLAITAVSIASQVWAIELLADAVGVPELTFAEATVVLGVLAIGFAMPNAPGFFGTVQLAMYAGLAMYIAPAKVAHEGAVLVFLFYVVYLAVVVVLALIAVVVEYVLPPAAAFDDGRAPVRPGA